MIEQLPVAALTVNGQRTAVAADGVVLGPALLSSSLPALNGFFEPLPGQHVHGPNLLAALAVLGAAPARARAGSSRRFTSSGGQGLTVAMRSGLLVYFGDASRPHAKWLSLARVLADPSSAGAAYIDVRLPERPAAGFAARHGAAAEVKAPPPRRARPPRRNRPSRRSPRAWRPPPVVERRQLPDQRQPQDRPRLKSDHERRVDAGRWVDRDGSLVDRDGRRLIGPGLDLGPGSDSGRRPGGIDSDERRGNPWGDRGGGRLRASRQTLKLNSRLRASKGQSSGGG